MAWGGGGGVWVISEKKILQNDFERKKNSWKEIPDENKIPTLKKNLSWRIVVKKNSYSVLCQEKILSPEVWERKFTQTKSKVKW